MWLYALDIFDFQIGMTAQLTNISTLSSCLGMLNAHAWPKFEVLPEMTSMRRYLSTSYYHDDFEFRVFIKPITALLNNVDRFTNETVCVYFKFK